MEQMLSARNKPNWNQMVAIVSLLDVYWDREQLEQAFGPENLTILYGHSSDLGYLKTAGEKALFTMPPEKIRFQRLDVSMLAEPVGVLWKGRTALDSSDLQWLFRRLSLIADMDEPAAISFLQQVGAWAERENDPALAIAVYGEAVSRARGIPRLGYRKELLVRSLLDLSRAEFQRGFTPRRTLEYQREAMELVNEANRTAEDTLLLLYTGISEHFCGSQQEGHILRELAIKRLEQFDYKDMEEVVSPLVGWHYYLLGNFTDTIAYYESTILTIQNRNDKAISTFSYSPIIFSYMFMGEYYRALTLAENLYRRALKIRDDLAAAMMLAHIGRIYVSMGELEKAESTLFQAYGESRQQDYGWGLYYTLLGICFLQYAKKNYSNAREYLALSVKEAQAHGFNAICASPFVLDVVKHIHDDGLEPVEGFDWDEMLQNTITAPSVYMSGVVYRLKALQGIEQEAPREEIEQCFQASIQRLEVSGCYPQIAETYLACANYYKNLGDAEQTRKYAQLAWSHQTDREGKAFPSDLIGYVEANAFRMDLPTMLETLWLELRHVVNPERLVVRMVTMLCRQMQAEAGAFLVKQKGTPMIMLAHNVDRDVKSAQYQRIMSIVAYTEEEQRVVAINPARQSAQYDVDLNQPPRFCVCVPFFNGRQIGAELFLESYYRKGPLSEYEKVLLEDFSKKISAHLFAILEYDTQAADGSGVQTAMDGMSFGDKRDDYCASIDETVLIIQAQIDKVAKTKIPILIAGETGVGKEVFCNEIFAKSGCSGPFIKVNCGAIPESLIESELFGYERGSFTGATAQKKGFFELADGGTLFLDEIGELPLQAQVKLLRVLQEHEFTRVGGVRTVKTDFRLIAATNKDLQREVEQGTFRKDLYYRLNVIQFVIPPIRERRLDIMNMARFFANKFCEELGRPHCQFSESAVSWMLAYDWPGNVREMENMIQRAVLLADGSEITDEMLFRMPGKSTHGMNRQTFVTLEEMERQYILQVLQSCGGRIAGAGGAAEVLGLKRTTLNSKLERLGIRGAQV